MSFDLHDDPPVARTPGDAPDLLGLPMPALAELLETLGVPTDHARRLYRGLHRELIPLEAIDGLGRHAATVAGATWRATADVVRAQRADDGTERLVLALADGARVEAVLVPMARGRTTLCLSTQVGCAMACAFCATGTLGLTRHLHPGEIVAQVHAARRHAAEDGRRVGRLVFMGMGEPLHAYESTRDALRVLLDPHGVSFGTKSVVVSTVGLPGRMRRFAEDFGGRVGLALSLHAGTDTTRRRIVPAARATSLAALREVLAAHPLPGSRYLMLEYVALPGVNDTEAELDGVAAFVAGLDAVVNVIPFNPFPGAGFRAPTPDEVTALYRGLTGRGVVATVRWPKGRDADGACGQLALREAAPVEARSAAPSAPTQAAGPPLR